MKEYFRLSKKERNDIKKRINGILMKRKDVVFAYLHGSFLNAPSFRDIDVAVFIEPHALNAQDPLNYELELSAKLVFSCPIDMRILNSAPFVFQNNVAHSGELLFCRDQEKLSHFLERSSLAMVHNDHIMRASFATLTS